jgi:hypothetical protein
MKPLYTANRKELCSLTMIVHYAMYLTSKPNDFQSYLKAFVYMQSGFASLPRENGGQSERAKLSHLDPAFKGFSNRLPS